MVKKYVDFDGVVMDTYHVLFEDYEGKNSDVDHVINKDWIYVLENSPIINDAIKIINDIADVEILTRVHSLENEAVAKIKYLRAIGLKCNIILVPYQLKKTDIVLAYGNVLVDDALFNLDEWAQAGGIPIFFDNRGTNTDGYGNVNKCYKRTRTLETLRDY